MAQVLGVSSSWVRQLADAGVLPSVRSRGGHRLFDIDAVRAAWAERTVVVPLARQSEVSSFFAEDVELATAQEDEVWRRVERVLGLSGHEEALGVAHYAFTEMLNNAIDHSMGATAQVKLDEHGDDLVFEIADDGVGAFEHLRTQFSLPSLESALVELTKGKRTTDPERHTGEGIFFTSKAVSLFELEANRIAWSVDNVRGDQAVGQSSVSQGTRVRFTVSRSASRDIGELFREFTDEDFRFNRSRPSVKLAEIGATFVSRSEAKRLLEGLEAFDEVEIDFAGVRLVGQGFADEVFRVWPSVHPGTSVIPVGMLPMVEFMVRRAIAAASDNRG